MWDTIEKFCIAHEHTIAAFAAASTFAAVITSLVLALLARRANRTHLVAFARMSVIMHATIDPKARPRYLVVHITNAGVMALHIPFAFFNWYLPFRRGTMMITPHDYSAGDPNVPQQRYPVEIPPRASHSFFVSEASMFEAEFKRMIAAGHLTRRALRWIRAFVITDDGMKFRVKIDDGVRRELSKIS